MNTLYFIRHAESEANEKDILASRQDFSLTEKGHHDAANIALALSGSAHLNRIMCSPLLRAQQTAAPIAKAFHLPVEIHACLTEQELGEFSGMTYAEIETRKDYMHDRRARWQWVPAGGGESYQMIADRLMPLFTDLASKQGENILCVTHAVTMRMIKALIANTLPNYPYDIAHNGEIWKVRFERIGQAHNIESIFLGRSKDSASRA